jgi:hypothetical protein
MAMVLLHCGAIQTVRNNDGKLASEEARSKGHMDMVNIYMYVYICIYILLRTNFYIYTSM